MTNLIKSACKYWSCDFIHLGDEDARNPYGDMTLPVEKVIQRGLFDLTWMSRLAEAIDIGHLRVCRYIKCILYYVNVLNENFVHASQTQTTPFYGNS